MTISNPIPIRRASGQFQESPGDIPCPQNSGLTEVIAIEERCPAGAVFHPGAMHGLLLSMTLSGQAHLEAGGRIFRYEPGTLLIAANGATLDREQVGDAREWHLCYLFLRGALADQISDYLRERHDPPAMLFSRITARRRQLFLDIFESAVTQTDGWQWALLSRATELFGELLAELRSATDEDRFVATVARFVDETADASLAQVAAHVGCTPRQFIYLFHKATGDTPARWIRTRRVRAAERLLGQGLLVSQVAERLGFANPYHFSRLFKSVTGVPPSTVSEQARNIGLHLPG